MDAMSSESTAEAEVRDGTSASGVAVQDAPAEAETGAVAEEGAQEPEAAAASESAGEPDAAVEPDAAGEPESAVEPEVPEQREAEPEPAAPEPSSKAKKRKSAPRAAKPAAGSKALVVLRDGKVHYADESVVVLDLDEAAHPDTDVHDVVDKLSELRDAAESAGRTEAVSLVADLIQAKALS
jgi:outer membrane biosynthesis protein TonB